MVDILDPTYRAQTEAAREGLVTQPANAAAIGGPERALTFAHNFVEGVPVVGPVALDLANRVMSAAAGALPRGALRRLMGIASRRVLGTEAK